MAEATKVGVIGCGAVSGAYLGNSKKFSAFDIVAVADLRLDAAKARAEEYGIPKACTPDELLADDEIEIVIVLTPHKAHGPVGISVVEAGKSVHIEKPLSVKLEDAQTMMRVAKQNGVRVSAAPDTFFGGAWQTARKLIDGGAIGEPIGAFSCIQIRGGGPWKGGESAAAPQREGYVSFYATDFFEFGVTWLFDRGPYYLHALINLLGPVARVSGSARNTWTERDRRGTKVECHTPTNFSGTLDFANGAVCTFINSSDVIGVGLPHIEIYGSEGSLRCIDPNNFGGKLHLRKADSDQTVEIEPEFGYLGNGRGVGVADLANAIKSGRPHRCAGEMGYHTADICHALHTSSSEERHIHLDSTCDQPAALPQGLADWEIDD
ncbi:MAG: Gfo/Idh/MocA family oxidoreductase [Candidatus Poribacteria bacterium]|nr:Gfo/Idh/MocA family oxidoreductase [Candidatus Poribacteria bacterium]